MTAVQVRDPSAVRVVVVDYGMGNLRSVAKIVSRTGADVRVGSEADNLDWATHVILPGVGAFHDAMQELGKRNLIEPLNRYAKDKGKPILGICLGMELLCKSSPEVKMTDGLAWIPATMVPFRKSAKLRVPHIGWNQLDMARPDPLMAGLDQGSFFYFVHSYYMACENPADVLARSSYGSEFVAVVRHENVMGTQFHPEKSQANGFRLLLNFVTEVS